MNTVRAQGACRERDDIWAMLQLKKQKLAAILMGASLYFSITDLEAQSHHENTAQLLFYNVENLFDTVPNPPNLDQDRTPSGKYRWSSKKYLSKIQRLSAVLKQIPSMGRSGPSLIGLCEIENSRVLRDLAQSPALKRQNYAWIHHDSPDHRGIDVALLYKKEDFLPVQFRAHRLLIEDEQGHRRYTRDQLVVSGLLEGEEIALLIVHWPSRSGGKRRSDPYRIAASKLGQKIVDSLYRDQPKRKIIVMGDMNDNPTDKSIQRLLQARRPEKEEGLKLHHPMLSLYRAGIGSIAYRDRWALFDQWIISEDFLHSPDGWKLADSKVLVLPELIQSEGRYQGYPKRTYIGTQYQEGYSDHFPILLRLTKEKIEAKAP